MGFFDRLFGSKASSSVPNPAMQPTQASSRTVDSTGQADHNLILAINQSNAAAVAEQLGQGANANALIPIGAVDFTPLTFYFNGRLDEQAHCFEIVELLLDNGADANRTNSSKIPPLVFSLNQENGHLAGAAEVVELLLEYGADANAASPRGATPLCCAAELGYVGLVNALLSAGANPNTPGVGGWTPLHSALSVPGDDVSVAASLINAGADVNFVNERQNRSILHVAAKMGKVNFVNLLIDEGVDIGWRADGILTALYQAVLDQQDAVAQALLEHGALRFEPIPSNLLAAAKSDSLINLLIQHGVEPREGMSLEDYEERRLRSELVMQAIGIAPTAASLTPPVSPNGPTIIDAREEATSLAGAILSGNELKVEKAIEAGYDVNKRYMVEGKKITPIVEAAVQRNEDIVEMLLEAGADPNISQVNGETALANAAQNGDYSIAGALLEFGADPNTMTPVGPPLAIAANIAIMQILCAYGADCNLPDEDGDLPIVGTITTNTYEATYFLRLMGTKILAINNRGESPLSKTLSRDNWRMIDIMASAHYDSPESSVNIISIRNEMLARIERLKSDDYPASHFANSSILAHGEVFSELQKATGEKINFYTGKAIDAKRLGNLELANEYYTKAFESDSTFNVDALWGWVKVLLLAKNFRDARLVMKYYSAISARRNEYCEQRTNPDLSFVAESARTFDFDGFKAFSEYTLVFPMDKKAVEDKVRAFGGSPFWQDYKLVPDEYDYFLRCFGIDDFYVKSGIDS